MHRSARLALLLLAFAPACASDDGGALAAAAPALGKADGTDSASHDCEVVLREAYRGYGDMGGYATDCSSGECLFVWNGAIDVAETAWREGASAHVLYHRTDDGTWWDVAAEAQWPEVPSYRRFTFSISDHLFGPSEENAGVEIELVAYLALPDGSRLFDHNRFAGDFENYVLDSEYGYAAYDNGVCRPEVAHISFDANYGGGQYGDFRQDGYISIEYALERLPECRATHDGVPDWDTVAYARFGPGGQLVQQSVRSFVKADGTPAATVESVPFHVDIPDEATSVEIWFRNFSGDGSSCETWDSNWGANYRYRILGAPGNAARCDGYELWAGNYSRPACLGYDVAAQYDADHCEMYLDGIGHAYEAHYGIPREWLEVYLHEGTNDGAVENLGMWLRYRDQDGAAHEQIALGSTTSPGVARTGFDLLLTGYMSDGEQNTVEEMAFFVDVRRSSGEVVRLWQSRHDANYSWDDAFGLPTTSSPISYGHAEWANQDAPIYDSRDACD